MHYLVIALIFFVSIYQTIRRGPGGTFVYVYLPVLLILGAVRPIELNKLPDVYSTMAVSYGTILGMIIGGRMPKFRPHFVDLLVLLCSITVTMSAVSNGVLWTLISAAGTETLRWLIPYYMARVAFRDADLRRRMAYTFCYISMALGGMGLIEFRLWPLFFSRILVSLGLSTAINDMVQGRWSFFRAMVTAEHPIDFGNMGLLLCGIVPMMAVVGGLRLKSWQVIGGTLAAVAIIGESISFSTFCGFGVAVAIFLVLRYVRYSEWLLVPATILAIVFVFHFTTSLLDVDLNAIRPANGEETQLAGSYYVRVLIVQNSWNSFGHRAGLLGFGDLAIDKVSLGLDSVDNSYMLFLMRRGWVHLLLRLFMGVVIAFLGTVMLKDAKTGKQRIPAAAAVAVLLGTMASMYTVWFGFVYACLWTVLLGMSVTMRQIIGGTVTSALPERPTASASNPYNLPQGVGAAYPATRTA